jgi:hypothetical protein
MKRYMCRKTIPHCFTAGDVYPVYTPSKGYEKLNEISLCFIDDEDCIHEITPGMLESHFTELSDDLPLPRDEAYPEPFTTPEPRRKLTAGWAWFIVLVITIGFFVLKAWTE